MPRRTDDLKTAFTLSAGFAVAAAVTVPLLLPSLPKEAQELPLPLPLFCVALAVQLTGVYGLLGFAGLRLSRQRGLDPAPHFDALWDSDAARPSWRAPARCFALGLGCGVVLVGTVVGIQRLFPGTLPGTLHPPGVVAALAASTAGSLGEEILFRLFALGLLLRILPRGRAGLVLAVGLSALAFGAAHAPAFVFLFGGWREVPALSWVWLIAINGVLGAAFGIAYLRSGIAGAILAHLGTDAVWHAATQCLRG